ncbi:site-specific integrase [Nioella sp. MMSF_3534]|uniref:tyrosine-type recombinase/integrase n=1 Tax=Nioella sp. MMSF_3534 TaxID=3046720 RepID=UPI00273D5AA2|nr:site-specific integrase [Nioella sp. MMSF_3534]
MSRLISAAKTGGEHVLDDPFLQWDGTEEFVDPRNCRRAMIAALIAVLELTWDRVDFDRRQIDLRTGDGQRKGRAIVPINDTLLDALSTARDAALSDYVVEWAGRPVRSIKKGFRAAVDMAELKDVSPHVLRHSAAVHMAEAGVSMDEISQYLGHSNTAITASVYARYSPGHLRKAASALEFGGRQNG